MKIFTIVFLATTLEASGDAVLRMSLHSDTLVARLGLFLTGSVLLIFYGTSLNMAPIDFGTVTGLYVAMVFISFQVSNYIFFRSLPHTSTLIGGAFILLGGAIIYIWR